MSNKYQSQSDKGYGDGYHGNEKNNSDEVSNPVERLGYATFDVTTGNALNTLQEADNRAQAYNDAYDKGVADKKSGK